MILYAYVLNNFARYCQNLFYKCCIILHSLQQWTGTFPGEKRKRLGLLELGNLRGDLWGEGTAQLLLIPQDVGKGLPGVSGHSDFTWLSISFYRPLLTEASKSASKEETWFAEFWHHTAKYREMGLELRQELAHIKKWGLFHESKNLFQDQQINEYSSLCEYIKGG